VNVALPNQGTIPNPATISSHSMPLQTWNIVCVAQKVR
jgi:hypothetical protein